MEYITLKDIAIINMGQSPDSKTYNEEKNGIPFYQGKSDFGKVNPIPRVWCSNPIKIAEKVCGICKCSKDEGKKVYYIKRL